MLAPRVVVRQSLQYALARKTLGLAAALPTTLLVVSLVEQRDRSLSEIVSGQPLFYAVLLALVIVGLKYRDRERAWLDRRFFRQEYDARALLLSLSGRIPYETDPNELTALVVQQIDAALHPTMVAVLVAGVEPGTLVPVSVLHGTADTLDERGGIGTMLTWSDTPLDLDLADERSAAGRLPPDEVEWLRCTGAVLFVPLSASESGTTSTARRAGPGRQAVGGTVLGRRPRAAFVNCGTGQPGTRRRAASPPSDRRLPTGHSPRPCPPTCRRAPLDPASGSSPSARSAARATSPTSRPVRRTGRRSGADGCPASSTRSTAWIACWDAAAWARCIARTTCGSSATSRSRSCARSCWPTRTRARGSGARRSWWRVSSTRASCPSSTTARCPTAPRFWSWSTCAGATCAPSCAPTARCHPTG